LRHLDFGLRVNGGGTAPLVNSSRWVTPNARAACESLNPCWIDCASSRSKSATRPVPKEVWVGTAGGTLIPAPQAGQRNVRPRASSGAANCREQLKHETVILIAPAKKSFSPLNFYLGARVRKSQTAVSIRPFSSSRTVACEKGKLGGWEKGRRRITSNPAPRRAKWPNASARRR